MANIYVRSTDGNDADNGTTWALAKATLAGATGIDAAGDTIYVSQSHAEAQSTGQNYASAGTAANPVQIICGNDAAEPPTETSTTATITTSATVSSVITFVGSAYVYGLNFISSTVGTSSFGLTGSDQGVLVFDTCTFQLGTGASSRITIGSTAATTENKCIFKNTQIKAGNVGQGFTLNGATEFTWLGGGIMSGSSAITSLVASSVTGTIAANIVGVDLSNGATPMNVLPASGITCSGSVTLRDCKLPASWSGNLCGTTPTNPGFRAAMYNCDSGDTNYKLWIETYAGKIREEVTIVKSSGMTDGATPISWKMTSNANTNKWVVPLISDWFVIPNSTTGSAVTVTAEILHDSATALKDDEVWLEVETVTTSGTTLGAFVDDKTTLLATAADQASSSVTWTTTGLTNPNKQKCVASITPQEAGLIRARVYLAKASYTVYVGDVTAA
jgi:hypothetical protein